MECVRVAEAVRDGESAFHARTAAGMLRLSRAEPQQAKDWFGEALGIARSANLREWIGAALHNAFIAARDAGDSRSAGWYAGAALEAYGDYGQGNRIPALTADVCEGALVSCPSPENAYSALSCWRGTVYNARTARERLIARVNAMGAAAILLNRRRFFEAADGFQGALNEASAAGEAEDVARCLTVAADASCRLGDFARAARVAADALGIALHRGETVVAEAAGEVRMAALQEREITLVWG